MSCRSCGRPTFAGCGAHVEQVLADVAPAGRCECDGQAARPRAERTGRSWFRKRS